MVPNIDYGLCEGCGGCAEAYPQFFEMRDDKAWVINADRFSENPDKGILLICPYYAITIE
jgi:ferredoxin